MQVTKRRLDREDKMVKQGEIIGVTIQAGSKNKDELLTIFSERYKKITMGYFLVTKVDKINDVVIIMDLKTKQEHTLEQNYYGMASALRRKFKEELKKRANEIKIGSWYRTLESDEKTFSTTISFYPSFVVTSLSNSIMNTDGTFTFSINDVDGIHLDKVARYKKKTMLKDLF